MIGVQNAKAYTVDDLTNAGWELVTGSLTDVNSKYFILIDAGNAYTSGMSVKHNANDSGSLYYQALGHPLSKNQMWKLSENDGKYTIQALNDDCYVNANSAGWNRSVDASESTGKYYITFSGGIWHINNTGTYNKGNTAFGPWNGTRTDGTEMNVAINKEDKQTSGVDGYAPGFYLYSLPRPQDVTSTYITNPSFETIKAGVTIPTSVSSTENEVTGWTTTTTIRTHTQVNGSTNLGHNWGTLNNVVDGNTAFAFESNNATTTGTIKQTVNLAAGHYILSVQQKSLRYEGSSTNYIKLVAGSTSSPAYPYTAQADGIDSKQANQWDKITYSTKTLEFDSNGGSVELGVEVKVDGRSVVVLDNFMLTYEPFADAADYTALNAAIATAEAHPLGFGVGEYAPYTNKDALVLLADAKAIDQSGSNTQRDVRTATNLLNAATWTENTEEVNAFRWIISDYKDNTDSQIPLGFTNGDGNAIRISANYGKNAGLNQLSQKMCLNINTNNAAIYGETDGYTLPLKGYTVYGLTFGYAGWGDSSGSPTITILKEDDSELKSVTLNPSSVQGNSTTEPWTSATILFQTTTAGNYKVSFSKTGNRTAFGDLELKKAPANVSVTLPSSGYGSLALSYGLDFSGVEGLTAYVVTDITNTQVKLTSVSELPANSGVILKGTGGNTYDIPVKADASYEGENKLHAAVTAYNCAANEVYILQGGLFHLVTEASTVPAGKAYLLAEDVPNEARSLIISDEEDPTAISAIEAAESEAGALKDGKYLIGNKIVLVKNGVKYSANGQKLN